MAEPTISPRKQMAMASSVKEADSVYKSITIKPVTKK